MQKEGNDNIFSIAIKGTLTVVIVSLVSVLAFAILVKLFPLSQGVVRTVNQFLKAMAVVLASVIAVKGSGGLFKGALIGAIGSVLTAILFSWVGGDMATLLTLICETAFGLIVGAIAGVIAVNLRK